jgi:hypothetical protein
VSNTITIGEKVRFVYFEKDWLYLKGTILSFDKYWCEIQIEDAYYSKIELIIPKSQIINILDINQKMNPEELCSEFKGSKFTDEMIEVFTSGNCYIFADWLKHHLYNSQIIYLKWVYHYVVLYQDKLYDITGDVTDKYKDEEYSIHRYYGDWRK